MVFKPVLKTCQILPHQQLPTAVGIRRTTESGARRMAVGGQVTRKVYMYQSPAFFSWCWTPPRFCPCTCSADKPFKTNEDVAQALGALWPPPPTKPQDASGAGPAAAPAVPAAPKAPGGTKPVEKPGKKRAGSTADTAAKKQRKK